MQTPSRNEDPDTDSSTGRPASLVELGVAEAYALARDHFGLTDLPPLDAIENEDWGRDYLLSRLAALSDAELAGAGLSRDDRLENRCRLDRE